HGPRSCKARPRRDTAKAQLGNRRAFHPAGIFLTQAGKTRLSRSRAYETAADQYDPLIFPHDFLKGDDEGLSKRHFLRHSSKTSARIGKVERSLGIRQRTLQRKTGCFIRLLGNLFIEPLNLITAHASAFDQLAREKQYRITIRVPGAEILVYAGQIPSPGDIGQSRRE